MLVAPRAICFPHWCSHPPLSLSQCVTRFLCYLYVQQILLPPLHAYSLKGGEGTGVGTRQIFSQPNCCPTAQTAQFSAVAHTLTQELKKQEWNEQHTHTHTHTHTQSLFFLCLLSFFSFPHAQCEGQCSFNAESSRQLRISKTRWLQRNLLSPLKN